MRRSSITPLQSQNSETFIVVELSGDGENDDSINKCESPNNSSDEESPGMNPFLLSPWRDTKEVRKHSLPTPQCSGITASQVRRLSERGDASAAREQAFLATLSAAPDPNTGGRRHSVVTISRVPNMLFGRNRRESVAAFPTSGTSNRILPSRRESIIGPPSTEPLGSTHNLQLDIMDDIVQARKVRMKMWNTSSERVCEVHPLDEVGGVQRYTNASCRRYSDFIGTSLTPIPSCSNKRRASELPPLSSSTASGSIKLPASGIVCSNTDLVSMITSLASSATEINQPDTAVKTQSTKGLNLEQKRSHLKSKRSNSFDISILHDSENDTSTDSKIANAGPSNWFVRRHQTIATKTVSVDKRSTPRVTFAPESDQSALKNEGKYKNNINVEPNKVMWDGNSGSVVDPQLLGSAIEVFLRRGGPESSDSTTSTTASTNKGAVSKSNKSSTTKTKANWFSNKGDENDSTETCDTSLCTTLKDLFVK